MCESKIISTAWSTKSISFLYPLPTNRLCLHRGFLSSALIARELHFLLIVKSISILLCPAVKWNNMSRVSNCQLMWNCDCNIKQWLENILLSLSIFKKKNSKKLKKSHHSGGTESFSMGFFFHLIVNYCNSALQDSVYWALIWTGMLLTIAAVLYSCIMKSRNLVVLSILISCCY